MPDEHKEQVKNELGERLEKSVKILMFTQALECHFCAETRQLVQEFAALNEKIELTVYDFVANAEKAKEYSIDKVPAIVIMGEKDYGIRIYGFPFGYEFQTLKETTIAVSKRSTSLSEETKTKLKDVTVPIHIQVFVTLTCPYCPTVSSLAHQFAVENDYVRTDVIDTGEFPYLGQKYGIMGVPKIVINEKIEFVGIIPEDLLLENVLLAAASTTK